jgi:chaperone BCS1
MTKKSREIKAATGISKTLQTDDDESLRDPEDDDDVLGADGLFSFEKWDSKNPIIYKPNTQCEFFTFNGRWFQWATSERKNVGGRGVDQLIYIRCLGRSTKPIKEFLNYIKSWTRNKEVETTSVYRSAAKSAQGGGEWNRQSVRPSRPLETVSLDDAQKAKIVRDINEYMHPATARWYAARGIPHRRGYLFHGPPGTGKTSLSFSLAGIFGLSIYCVSLSETGLTETELGALFASLPERCIVLLEDIDSAGIRREDDALSMTAVRNADGSEESSDSKSGSESNPKTVFEEDTQPKGWFRFLYRALVKPVIKDVVAMTPTRENVTNGMPFPNRFNRKQSLISLAGLLNIIDGAASHEASTAPFNLTETPTNLHQGRVLIMTTNYPEQLDPALIRPGRVDLQIRFTLATRDQICDIFKRM